MPDTPSVVRTLNSCRITRAAAMSSMGSCTKELYSASYFSKYGSKTPEEALAAQPVLTPKEKSRAEQSAYQAANVLGEGDVPVHRREMLSLSQLPQRQAIPPRP